MAGLILASLVASASGAACRLSLQLALDVSGSVDSREYRLQLDGIAWALESDEVRAALLAMPVAPVVISVYEWSGRADQRVIADWWEMRSDPDVDGLASLLRATTRREAAVSTGIGTALMFGRARLDTRPPCARAVIDISGDGKNNDGPRPQDVRAGLGGLVVNALVVGPGHSDARGAKAWETEDLVEYFRRNVIHGPKAFVEVADGYDAYAETMKRKLLRELRAIALSGQPAQTGTRLARAMPAR